MGKKEFTKVVLHVPHSSAVIPKEYLRSFPDAPERELELMTDWYTDILFDCRHASLVFPISRLICDVERFRDDENEPMSEKGMGAVYTRAHDGSPLRKIGENEREAILREWYDPHHLRLDRMVADRLDAFGSCLIVDCHSFNPVPLPHEPDQRRGRPDICVGTDGFHTPPKIAKAAVDAVRSRGYSVGINTPFSGSLVPMRYYRRVPEVTSVMLEINRGLYLEKTAVKSNFEKLRRDVTEVIEALSET